MNIKILIISLIFSAVLYILLYIAFGYFFAASFLVGVLASLLDIVALTWLIKSMFGKGGGWLFIPLGVLRWALFGVIIFIALYFFKVDPIGLIIGIGVPFVTMLLLSIYYTIIGGRNGTSS